MYSSGLYKDPLTCDRQCDLKKVEFQARSSSRYYLQPKLASAYANQLTG